MTNKNIYMSLGGLDPELIMKAAPAEKVQKKKKNSWVKWASLAAACFALVICAMPIMNLIFGGSVPNDGGEIELPTEMPKDFAIKFSSKYMAEEFYDTYTGTIQKDLVENGTATANFAPNEGTLKTIYSKVLEYEICSIDRKMTNDVLADKEGLQFSVSPNHTYEIKITANGNTYIIRGDDTAQGFKNTDNDAQGFVNFIGFMRSVLYETPEYKNLPDAVGGYN